MSLWMLILLKGRRVKGRARGRAMKKERRQK
jgi:hypothetical protein